MEVEKATLHNIYMWNIEVLTCDVLSTNYSTCTTIPVFPTHIQTNHTMAVYYRGCVITAVCSQYMYMCMIYMYTYNAWYERTGHIQPQLLMKFCSLTLVYTHRYPEVLHPHSSVHTQIS